MGDDRSLDLVTYARELEASDADLAGRIFGITELLREVDRVRESARRVGARLDDVPDEIEHAEEAERDARAREADVRRELEEAERRLEEVRRSRRSGEDATAAAERALRRASVAAADAASGVDSARGRLEALVIDEAALQAEREALTVEAREVAAAVAAAPRVSASGRSVPGASLEEIEEWGARAHAALFVVRGGLENERERLVLEANTLAAAALGENVGGSSVALVRRRLEEALGGG